MASWTKGRDGQWVVIGTVEEMGNGWGVRVTKRNGETQTVNMQSMSKPFIGQYGFLKGKKCVIGVPAPRENGQAHSTRNGGYVDEEGVYFRSYEEYIREMED